MLSGLFSNFQFCFTVKYNVLSFLLISLNKVYFVPWYYLKTRCRIARQTITYSICLLRTLQRCDRSCVSVTPLVWKWELNDETKTEFVQRRRLRNTKGRFSPFLVSKWFIDSKCRVVIKHGAMINSNCTLFKHREHALKWRR